MTTERIRPSSETELRAWAEGVARNSNTASPDDLAAMAPAEMSRMLHELRVHQIELQTQNDELRRTQVELSAAQARYFDLYDLAPVGYCTLAEDGMIREANFNAAALLGLARGDLAGQPITRFILAEDQDIWYLHRKRLLETGEAQACELRMARHDGAPFWAHLAVAIARDADGALVLRAVLGDVTERKHLELARDESVAKLRDSEAFNVAVLDSLAAHIAVVDESGVIVAVNNAWRQFAVSNSAPGQAANPVGANYLAVCDHAANSAGAEDALRAAAGIRAILAGEQSSFDWESACHSPGGRRWFHTCLTPLRSKRRGAVISHDNITERQEAQAARTLLESQLRQAQKMEAIGTLAGGIAHDFNNIIATILGNTELARQDARASPKALESLEEIRKAGARARELVKQILSFSRREPTERKAVSLIAVVDESVRVLRMALPPLVQLDVRRDAEVPWVLADATQIGQVLINLVNNAAQAMQGGPGRIGIHLGAVPLDATLAASHPALLEMRAQHPGPLARLVVSDTGPGMDAATLERIFEPFFTTKAVDEGTGLGLAVVHGIVRAHGGAITVESVPGKGAVFTVYLPVIETPIETTQRGATGASAMPAHTPEVGQHILYLDDEEALVFLVKRLLTRRGYRVSGYIMQDEALAALRADPGSFDLVLTDYNMPGMSGLDVAAEVHAIRGDLPVAIASGFVDENLRARASAAGVRDLIFKANAVEEFCDVVQRLLARPS